MGGSATNIGVEYQQRVSAWFLLQLYLGIDIDLFFKNFTEKISIMELRYESDSPIDDLNIIGKDKSLYAQIKRNLSLSSDIKSDLYSVLSQFTKKYLESNGEGKYLLITSSLSSKKIRVEFCKITESIRSNRENFEQNPLNKSEEDTLRILYECFDNILSENDYKLKKDDLKSILRRIYVLTFDIESTQPLEITSLMQIQAITNIDPQHIWNICITKSLEFAGKRMSVSKSGIEDILLPYIENNDTNSSILKNESFFNMVFAKDRRILSGLEYFLGRMTENGKETLVIFEFYRFDDKGNLRININNGKVSLSNGLEFDVIFRSSTITRLFKMIEESNYSKDKINYLQSNIDSEEENNKTYAMAWSEKLQKSTENPNILYCVHCSKFVSEHNIFSIEYMRGNEPFVGVVHKDCLKGSDRILGYIEFPAFENRDWLKYFDIEKWIYSYCRSINIVERTRKINNPSIHILWDDTYIFREGEYCIGLRLSDGSVEYIIKRAKIESFSSLKKEEELNFAKDMIKNGIDSNDPWCYLSESRLFGKYSYLLTQKSDKEEILEIQDCFIDEYSLNVKQSYEKAEYYYAPLLFLVDIESGEDFNLGQFSILLSNPFKMNEYINNWKIGGEIIPEYRVEILENDEKVDKFFRDKMDKGNEILVDPLIDKNHNIVNAIPIMRMSQLERR